MTASAPPAAAPVVAVVGPTASGKSDLGVALARELGGEVVNADSMQLYRGMDVGTAKLGPDERGGVVHHLLDVWDVREAASVAEYQRLARAAVDDVRGRGSVALLVGGSGLYVRAVLDEMDFPGTDPEVRARLEAELEEVGAGAMHARLAAVDPVAAQAILPSNGRRIVRALEVVEITGEPFVASLPQARPAYPSVQIGLDVPRPELDARIDLRVERMWAAGLVDEVRRLSEDGLREGRHRVARARLRAGAAVPRRRVHRGGGAGRDAARDPALRAPAGHLVPPRRAHRVDPVRRRRPARAGPAASCADPAVGRERRRQPTGRPAKLKCERFQLFHRSLTMTPLLGLAASTMRPPPMYIDTWCAPRK